MFLLHIIDRFLNSITMYRLVMYGLLLLATYAVALGFLGILPDGGISLTLSLVFLFGVPFFVNFLFAKLFRAAINAESAFITGLILFFLLVPLQSIGELWVYAIAVLIAMGSKYIFAFRKHHIFNPAAISLVTISILGIGGGIWWVAHPYLLLPTLILGLLVVRKIRRFNLFFSFLLPATLVYVGFGITRGNSPLASFQEFFMALPTIFFATIMLTEPFTTPPTRALQVMYGLFVGVLYSTPFSVGFIVSSPEMALVMGNIFSFILSRRQKYIVPFLEKRKIAKDTYEFVFEKPKELKFKAGQYLEWTLPQLKTDGRGNRRFFTIASSPTEDKLKLGVKYSDKPSSFKTKLLSYKQDEKITADELTGDFTLPKETNKKLVFIAGGIGVTPFRSIIKYLIDTNEKRDVVLLYSNTHEDEVVYSQLFGEARKHRINTIYFLTDEKSIPTGWKGGVGRLNEKSLKNYVPDYKSRTFYLSGPIAMVDNYKKLLRSLGVPHKNLVTDYFPGY